jgi:hypothetical protein
VKVRQVGDERAEPGGVVAADQPAADRVASMGEAIASRSAVRWIASAGIAAP